MMAVKILIMTSISSYVSENSCSETNLDSTMILIHYLVSDASLSAIEYLEIKSFLD